MKEEDDMLELLDEEDLGSDPSLEEELELPDESVESGIDEDSLNKSLEESLEESLELDETAGEPEGAEETEDESEDELDLEEEETRISETPEEETEEPEKPEEEEGQEEVETEGFEIDIRYIAVAAVAIIAIIAGIVFLVLPMMADEPPQVSFSKDQSGDDIYFTHLGGEPLQQDYLIILINGVQVPADRYQLMGTDWPWTEGVRLKLDITGYAKPVAITLVYKPKSLDHVIYGTTIQATPTPTPIPTPTPVPTMVTPISTPVIVQPAPSTVTMSVSPVSGSAPLTVQCSDQTNGCIRDRVWNFGDGQTSMKRNPEHVFPYSGTYNVTLDVRFCDPDDNPDKLPVKTVTVVPSVRHDTLAQGTGTGTVTAGGKIYFIVKGPGTNIRIAGMDHYLKAGDHVQLTLGNTETGEISIVSQAILKCSFSNVTLNVNGEDIENGTISVININQYLELETADLTITIIAGKDGAKGMVDANPVISAAPGQEIILRNVGIDSTGKLIFSVQKSAGFNFRGGTGSYQVLTPPLP